MGDGTIQSAVFLDLRLLLCLLITFLLKISTSFQYFIQKVVILLVKCYDKGRLQGHGFYCNDKGQLEEHPFCFYDPHGFQVVAYPEFLLSLP